jgi:hypothetical protein
MISEAGRRRPASADVHDADSVSCSRRRCSSVRSSPSSSTTRSMTVPSGRVVGSSRMRRPFSTRARRGLMRLLYGFPPWPARTHAGCRKLSICLSQATIWFQLAGIGDASLRSEARRRLSAEAQSAEAEQDNFTASFGWQASPSRSIPLVAGPAISQRKTCGSFCTAKRRFRVNAKVSLVRLLLQDVWHGRTTGTLRLLVAWRKG